jgi:predicted GH43/DUF377 family glycosyl hydrolase
MRILVFLLSLILSPFSVQALYSYTVVATKLTDQPIISQNQSSTADFNYNAAAYTYNGSINLYVRSQNLLNQSEPFSVGPSFITASQITLNNGTYSSASQATSQVFGPLSTIEACGTEDPRIAENNGLYYLFYTAYNCSNAMLSMATSTNPVDPLSWIRHGYILPERNWSKSGAALFATPENGLDQHYLFWGDSSSPPGGIGIATSQDGIHWNDTGDYLMQIRNDSFDSNLVESGPPPLQLSSGDFLFVHNSALAGIPTVKPNWNLQYNVGYVILSGSDPTQVLQRSDTPIFSPNLTWEVGNSTEYLTPDVVFIEGLVPNPNGCPANASAMVNSSNYDCFFGVYGAADSNLGAVSIVVGWTSQSEEIALDTNEDDSKKGENIIS